MQGRCLQSQRLFGMFLHSVLRTNQGWRSVVPPETRGAWELPNASLRIRDLMQSQAYCFPCWLFEALSLGEGLPAKTLPLILAKLPGAGMVSWMISPESTAEKGSLPDTGGRVLSFTWGRSKDAHSSWDTISTPCRHSHYNFLKVISNFHLIWWVKFNH